MVIMNLEDYYSTRLTCWQDMNLMLTDAGAKKFFERIFAKDNHTVGENSGAKALGKYLQ